MSNKASALLFSIIFSAFLFAIMPFGAIAQSRFSDVSQITKYREAILALADAGIIRGYPDGTFKPYGPLHRAELVKLAMEAQGISIVTNNTSCFPDVNDPEQWFFNTVCTAKTLGIALGYPDGMFRPGDTVNRAEATAFLCRVQTWNISDTPAKPFPDVQRDAWFADCLNFAKINGFLTDIAKENTNFLPANQMRRGIFSELLYESLKFTNAPSLSGNNTPTPLFMDAEQDISATTDITVSQLQQAMLILVNEERSKEGLSSVILDNELSLPAQLHSNDMVSRSFFDHVNPDGFSPDDRRKASGITTLVGENLAKAQSLESAHQGLMNSPPHRANILNPSWERLGIGVAKDSQGYILFTQLFSTLPVTANNLISAKNRIIGKINEQRILAGIVGLNVSASLDSVAIDWSQTMADGAFFDVEAPDGKRLMQQVQSRVSAHSYQAMIFQTNELTEAFDDLVLEGRSTYLNDRMRSIGLGFAIDPSGIIKLTVLYTD